MDATPVLRENSPTPPGRPPRVRRSAVTIGLVVAVLTGAVIAILLMWIPAQRTTSTAVAEVVEVDGLLHLVTGDLEAVRIQQPGAAELAELEAQGVRLGNEVTQLTLADEPTGSRFVIVPPDGPDAQVHLLVDGVLYPVVTNVADQADLTVFEEASVSILSRLDAVD
jgi:hypothetical protein